MAAETGLVVLVVQADLAVAAAAVVAEAALAQPFSFAAAALGCVAAWDFGTLAVAVVVVAAAAAATAVGHPSCEDPADPSENCPFVVEVTSSSVGYPFRQSLAQAVDLIVFVPPLELFVLLLELQESVEILVCRHDCSSCRCSCLAGPVAYPSDGAASVVPSSAVAAAVEVVAVVVAAVVVAAAVVEASMNFLCSFEAHFPRPSCLCLLSAHSFVPFFASS